MRKPRKFHGPPPPSPEDRASREATVDAIREMMGFDPLYRPKKRQSELERMLNMYHHSMGDGNRRVRLPASNGSI
jgi:hypothetical protein